VNDLADPLRHVKRLERPFQPFPRRLALLHDGREGVGQREHSKQLRAVDGLIAYIDAYYGFESEIIDHKAWRTGNSDCSAEFEPYLANLRATRTHDGSARTVA
jgi:hypothetical protein